MDSVSEAIMAELLGDVGKMRDEVKGLSAELAEPLQAIADAIHSGKTAVESHADNKKHELKELSERERVIMEQRLVDAVNKVAQDLERAGQRMAREIGRPEGLPGWVQIAFAFGVGVVASVTSISTRSTSSSPMPRMPPQQTFMPDCRTFSSVSSRS